MKGWMAGLAVGVILGFAAAQLAPVVAQDRCDDRTVRVLERMARSLETIARK